MGAFSYSALDPRGRRKRGVLEGDNPRQVRQKLREQGLMPLEVAEVAQEATRGGGLPARDFAHPASFAVRPAGF